MWFANARRHQKNKDKLTRELKNNLADEDSKSECSVATEEVHIHFTFSFSNSSVAIVQYEGSHARATQPYL